MRIVAGTFGGRRLLMIKGRDIRPTSDKARGAVFNALMSRGAVEGAMVLDCFCGTGALGLEALSRGAAKCAFIDSSRASLDIARENAESLGLKDEVSFLFKDVSKPGRRPENIPPASLVFLDPPYNRNLVPGTLTALHEGRWLGSGAFCVAETEKKSDNMIPPFYGLLDERLYGAAKILFLRYNPGDGGKQP